MRNLIKITTIILLSLNLIACEEEDFAKYLVEGDGVIAFTYDVEGNFFSVCEADICPLVSESNWNMYLAYEETEQGLEVNIKNEAMFEPGIITDTESDRIILAEDYELEGLQIKHLKFSAGPARIELDYYRIKNSFFDMYENWIDIK